MQPVSPDGTHLAFQKITAAEIPDRTQRPTVSPSREAIPKVPECTREDPPFPQGRPPPALVEVMIVGDSFHVGRMFGLVPEPRLAGCKCESLRWIMRTEVLFLSFAVVAEGLSMFGALSPFLEIGLMIADQLSQAPD